MNIRAVIIAARGGTISSNFLSGLLETDAIALHADERHQPCGWTALHDSALEIRDEVGFFQEVRAVLAKFDLKPEERPKIDPNFEEVTEDAEESMKESLRRK